MYANRNRSKAIRRWLPQNRGARDIVRWSDGGRNAGEDRICCGGAPARRGGFAQTRRRSRAERGKITGQTSATISAQRKPASSRAMAAATTERTFLCAASWRNRRDKRTCAAHERATVSGDTVLALSDADAHVGAVLVGPGRFTELASQVGIAGPGDRAPPLGQTRRVLPGHEAGEAHEESSLGEATPVEHLGSQTQRTDSGHAPVGGQA